MFRSFAKKPVLAVIFAFAFVVNPAYLVGCNSEAEDEPNFGEAEMVALLDDLNGMTTTAIEDDAEYEVDLALTQSEGMDAVSSRAGSLVVRAAHACGSRTFLRSAGACLTETILEVEGTLSVRRVDGDQPVIVAEDVAIEGQILAYGDTLGFVSLELTFAAGSASWVTDDNLHFQLSTFDATNLGPDAVDIAYH